MSCPLPSHGIEGMHSAGKILQIFLLLLENILVWHGSKSNSTEILKNSALASLTTASASLSWSVIPSVIQDENMVSLV